MREFFLKLWVLLAIATFMTSAGVFSQHGIAGESPQSVNPPELSRARM